MVNVECNKFLISFLIEMNKKAQIINSVDLYLNLQTFDISDILRVHFRF